MHRDILCGEKSKYNRFFFHCKQAGDGIQFSHMQIDRLKQMLKDVHVLTPVVVSGVIILFSFIGAYAEFFGITEKIIMHLNFKKEIDVLGARKEIFGVLVGFSIFGIGNFGLCYALYWRERLLSYFVSYGTLFISCISLWYIYTLAHLN